MWQKTGGREREGGRERGRKGGGEECCGCSVGLTVVKLKYFFPSKTCSFVSWFHDYLHRLGVLQGTLPSACVMRKWLQQMQPQASSLFSLFLSLSLSPSPSSLSLSPQSLQWGEWKCYENTNIQNLNLTESKTHTFCVWVCLIEREIYIYIERERGRER